MSLTASLGSWQGMGSYECPCTRSPQTTKGGWVQREDRVGGDCITCHWKSPPPPSLKKRYSTLLGTSSLIELIEEQEAPGYVSFTEVMWVGECLKGWNMPEPGIH